LRRGRDGSRRRRAFPGRQLHAVLLGKNARERERREVAVGNDDLPEEAATCRLLAQRLLELVLGQQLLGDEELAELPPGKLKRRALHPPLIGSEGSIVQSDRKSTRLNSSHQIISYAVFCLKKKNKHKQ